MHFYNFFKHLAKEFSKFAFAVSELVFRGLLLVREKEEWACIARLQEFIQNHAPEATHEYNGLLYRVNESAIVVSSHVGEVVVVLTKIFRVSVADQSMYFVCAKPFRVLGFSDCGGKLVQEGNQINVFPVESISRKVILAKDEDVAGHPSYLVVDYMRHIFPVTPGTVVVPYCPCINDMVA